MLPSYHLQTTRFPLLHQLIAQDPPQQERILKIIKSEIGLETKDAEFGLTPLHVAAMAGNQAALAALINAGASELRRDVRGWTARHHAALHKNEELLELLAPHDEKTNLGCTVDEMRKSLTPVQSERRFWYKPPECQEPQLLPPECFPELTGATYIDRSFVTCEFLKKCWHTPAKDESDAALDLLTSQLEDCNISDDKVFLAKTQHCGLGLYARVAIKAGEVFLRYLGLVSAESSSSYVLSDTDAEQFGSLASRANHSFPNTLVHYIQRGEIEEPIFIATVDIAPGEEITINYGDAAELIIGSKGVELQQDALQAFQDEHLRDKTSRREFYRKIITIMCKTVHTQESALELHSLMNALHYTIITNPEVLNCETSVRGKSSL